MKAETGNALFLVFIGVALFAALSYAVTQSSRGGNISIEKEQVNLDAGVNRQCAALVAQGVKKLKMLNDCTAAQISYELPGGGNQNPDNLNNKSCFLFHPSGAGITPCGSYAEVTGPPVGMIAHGDTETVALLSNGLYFKCTTWPTQGSNYSTCNGWQYAIDGMSFSSEPLCFGKTTTERNQRNSQTPSALTEFGSMICEGSCGFASYGDFVQDTNTAENVPAYYRPDKTVESYEGPCVEYGSFDPNDFVKCGCWGSDYE